MRQSRKVERERENVIILWKWLQTFAKATTTYRKRAVERTVEVPHRSRVVKRRFYCSALLYYG